MNQPKEKIDYKEHETPDPAQYPNLSNVASVNECTGLMYTPPQNPEEIKSYQHLSSMEIPREGRQVKREKGKDNRRKGSASRTEEQDY